VTARFLQPGHLVVSVEPMTITTILGSCVAVCIWDYRKCVGGMNHFMLPIFSGGSAASSPRFGDVAMHQLIEGLRAVGAKLPFMRARVFGGACMFPQMQSDSHLGNKNVEVALDALAANGIEVIQIDAGGNRGRKVLYETQGGTACLTSI